MLLAPNSIIEKFKQLSSEEYRRLERAFKYIGTDTKPKLPAPLLAIYEELNQFNLEHNSTLKKKN